MGFEGKLRYLKTRHPNPIRDTPTKNQIRDELSDYVIGFADERKKSSYKNNQLAVSQIQHYVRVIEFERYAKLRGGSISSLEGQISSWISMISELSDLGLGGETRIARLNATLWKNISLEINGDSVYQAGFESYHLARHMIERTKRASKTGVVETLEKVISSLNILRMIKEPFETNDEFQKDVLLEQRRYLCRELTKKLEGNMAERLRRKGFAKIEACILKQLAKKAGDQTMTAFARHVINPARVTPSSYSSKYSVYGDGKSERKY